MKCILIFFLITVSQVAKAQSLTDSLSGAGAALQDSVAEKLAALALTQNANLKVADKQIEGGLYTWQRTKVGLLDNFAAIFNVNEGNINPPKDRLNLFYPRYNLRLTLPFGTFITTSKDKKIAKAQYEGFIASKDVVAANLKMQVKEAYQVYQTNKVLLALQELVLRDEEAVQTQVQKKFEANKATLAEFSDASKRYNAELVKKVNLLRDVNLSKFSLENLLGMPLEAALQQISTAAPAVNNQRRK